VFNKSNDDCLVYFYRHTMEMEQMMECLLAEIRANQDKTDANLKEIIAKMRTWCQVMKARREATEAYPESTEARIETGQKTNGSRN
jgi:hypothetical protein